MIMASRRLLDNLMQREPIQREPVFGGEDSSLPVDHAADRAPVKRVALIAEAFLPKVDGVSKSAFLTLRYLQQTGREVLVFAPDIAPPAVGPSRVIALPSLGLPAAPETRVALPNPVVARHIRKFQPDLIQLFSPALMSINGVAMGRHLGIPVIANYQTDLPGYAERYGLNLLIRPARDWLRYVHNQCHLTLVPSNHTRQQLQSWGYRRLRRWGRGVNGQRFNQRHRTSRWRDRLLNGQGSDTLRCLYVGRLAVEKRIDLLLDVAKLPGIALTIVGDGPLREELETQFAGTQTQFTGYLFGDELSQAYASADLFLFTGANETFGQVVQEAMASALPVVIIDQGGVTDLVQDGVNGFTCPDDPQAFAAIVTRLRDNPALRQRMARASRRLAERSPWSAVMTQLEDYYREATRLNARYNHIFRDAQPPLPLSRLFQWGR
jgi:glycosyltransferase involved in cell wall biosynthesis